MNGAFIQEAGFSEHQATQFAEGGFSTVQWTQKIRRIRVVEDNQDFLTPQQRSAAIADILADIALRVWRKQQDD